MPTRRAVHGFADFALPSDRSVTAQDSPGHPSGAHMSRRMSVGAGSAMQEAEARARAVAPTRRATYSWALKLLTITTLLPTLHPPQKRPQPQLTCAVSHAIELTP